MKILNINSFLLCAYLLGGISMPRKGRCLEILVAQLQEQLAEIEVSVKSPEEFYKRGTKVGEIDITLRGKIGSVKIAIGIECRDRPSEGPQGIPWINELIGKRTQHGLNKVVAVSTTGFVKEALRYAHKEGIDTIIVDRPEELSTTHFFEKISFFYQSFSFKVSGKIIVDLVEAKIDPMDRIRNMSGSDLIFIDCDGKKQNMNSIIISELNKLPSYPVGHTDLIMDESKYSIEIDNINTRIRRFQVPLEISKGEMNELAGIANICHDADGNVIGKTGVFEIEEQGEPFYYVLSIIEKEHNNLRVKSYNHKFEPVLLNGHFTLSEKRSVWKSKTEIRLTE